MTREFKVGDRVTAFGITGTVVNDKYSDRWPIYVSWDSPESDQLQNLFYSDGRGYRSDPEPMLKHLDNVSPAVVWNNDPNCTMTLKGCTEVPLIGKKEYPPVELRTNDDWHKMLRDAQIEATSHHYPNIKASADSEFNTAVAKAQMAELGLYIRPEYIESSVDHVSKSSDLPQFESRDAPKVSLKPNTLYPALFETIDGHHISAFLFEDEHHAKYYTKATEKFVRLLTDRGVEI